MLAIRLVRLIESHSDKLAEGIMHRFLASEQCSDLRKIPPVELSNRTYELLHNLCDWLTEKAEKNIEKRYVELGMRRAAQGIALSHFVWALGATRVYLHSFVRREASMDNTVELVGTMELLDQIDLFFDRALYYGSIGFEMERQPQKKQRTWDVASSF